MLAALARVGRVDVAGVSEPAVSSVSFDCLCPWRCGKRIASSSCLHAIQVGCDSCTQ